MTPVFFNTFVNVEKYLEYEQRDPVTTAKVGGAVGVAKSITTVNSRIKICLMTTLILVSSLPLRMTVKQLV